jgi:hypothetical protein
MAGGRRGRRDGSMGLSNGVDDSQEKSFDPVEIERAERVDARFAIRDDRSSLTSPLYKGHARST